MSISFDKDDVTVYENDDLNDCIGDFDDLMDNYGEIYYETKEYYKKGNAKKFFDFIDELF